MPSFLSTLMLSIFMLCVAGSLADGKFPVIDGTARAENVKLTTWNMNWLTLRPAGDTELPEDVLPRQEEDFRLLRAYADQLKSDIIAFEEVDGSQAASKVFDPDIYTILLSNDQIVQRVGLAVRKGWTITRHPDVTALDVSSPTALHHLRSGLDVTLSHGEGQSVRVLVLHLKTGCWARPLTEQRHSCPTLYQQFALLEDWIIAREIAGEAYILIGDFNRRLTKRDPLMKNLTSDAPLTLTTEGYASPCEGGRRFIDHIILGGAARQWLVEKSLRVMTFRPVPATRNLSDHCPVSVTLDIP